MAEGHGEVYESMGELAVHVVRDLEERAASAGDPTPWESRIVVVSRGHVGGFGKVPTKAQLARLRKRDRASLRGLLKGRERQGARVDEAIAAMLEKARAGQGALSADLAKRMQEEFPKDLTYARAVVGQQELLDVLEECERRGDRSWYADGSNGVYHVSFMDE